MQQGLEGLGGRYGRERPHEVRKPKLAQPNTQTYASIVGVKVGLYTQSLHPAQPAQVDDDGGRCACGAHFGSVFVKVREREIERKIRAGTVLD